MGKLAYYVCINCHRPFQSSVTRIPKYCGRVCSDLATKDKRTAVILAAVERKRAATINLPKIKEQKTEHRLFPPVTVEERPPRITPAQAMQGLVQVWAAMQEQSNRSS